MADKTMGGEEDTGFRVTDRRRGGPDEPREASEAAGQAPGADVRLLPVPDLVRLFIGELHTRAWMHMGLIVNPATKEITKDLPQARLAIDCIAGLVEQLSAGGEQGERDELERLLADLRINFVRQAGP